MATEIKERIASDLQKAKGEGGVRAERIRDIVKSAVAQAVDEIKGELKGGSGEIGTIARDAVAAVVEFVKEKGQGAKADVTASVEGVIDGIRESREQQMTQTQAQVDQLQTQLDAHAEQIEAEVDGALVAIESEAKHSSSDFKTILESVVSAIRESKQFAVLQEQYAKLRGQLAVLDERLAERYGDRYDSVKHQLEKYWESAKVWYEKNKTDVKAGTPDPVQQTQVDLAARMAALGTAAARKEKEVKTQLKEKLNSDA